MGLLSVYNKRPNIYLRVIYNWFKERLGNFLPKLKNIYHDYKALVQILPTNISIIVKRNKNAF